MAEELTLDKSAWDSLGSESAPKTTDTPVTTQADKSAEVKEAPKSDVPDSKIDKAAVEANNDTNQKDIKKVKLPVPSDAVKLDVKKLKAIKEGIDYVEPDKKEDDKVEQKEEVKVQEGVKEDGADKSKKGERDFTGLEGLTDGEKHLLKNMSLPSFEYVKSQMVKRDTALKESKERISALEKSVADISKEKHIPANWYEHEQAYVLSPEYGKSFQAKNDALQMHNYWQQQFVRVRAGEQWTDLRQGPDGKWSEVVMEPSAQAEATLMHRVNQAAQTAANEDVKLASIQSGFKAQVEGTRNLIKSREDVVFPAFTKDAKLIETSPHCVSMKAALKEAALDGNPLASTLVKYHHYHMELLKDYRTLRQEVEAKKVAVTERAKGGPTSSEINRGSNTTGGKTAETYKMGTFKKLINDEN